MSTRAYEIESEDKGDGTVSYCLAWQDTGHKYRQRQMTRCLPDVSDDRATWEPFIRALLSFTKDVHALCDPADIARAEAENRADDLESRREIES